MNAISNFDSVEDHIFLSGTELGIALNYLVDGFHQIFLRDALSSGSDGEHASLGAHTLDICAGGVGAHSCD